MSARLEKPAALQLRQGVSLPVARAVDRRSHKRLSHSCPLGRNSAGGGIDPHRQRDRLAYHASACLLPATDRRRRGAARVGPALNVRCSLSTGLRILSCVAEPAASSTRANHATAWRAAVFIHRLGEIRDRTYENQQHRASGLNLLVSAIILWNTRYLDRAINALRAVEQVPEQLLAHLSRLGWEHVNLTGDYVWATAEQATGNPDEFRPLPVVASVHVSQRR